MLLLSKRQIGEAWEPFKSSDLPEIADHRIEKYFHIFILHRRKLNGSLGDPHSRYGRSEEEQNFCPYWDSNSGPFRLWQVAFPLRYLVSFRYGVLKHATFVLHISMKG